MTLVRGAWAVAASAWLAVAATEVWSVPSTSVLLLIVPPAELGLWLLAGVLTLRSTHRRFAVPVGMWVRNGAGPSPDAYYGTRLPWHLRDLSTTGRAAVIGYQDGKPVVFLPQWLGIPDDAVGYAFLDAKPHPELVVDLFGRPVRLVEGRPLGGGWWYLRP